MPCGRRETGESWPWHCDPFGSTGRSEMRAAPSGSCHVCGTRGRLLHRALRDRLYGVAGEWNFRRCENRSCGLVWLDPMPIEPDLHEAYADCCTHGAEGRGAG